MNLNEAIRHAINGHGLLFAGAGFSSGVKNQNGEIFKRAKELCEILCDELEIEFFDDLGYISQRYITEKGEESLIKLLQREFISKEPLEIHKEILKLAWKRIYTTNYDDVIEKATDSLGLSRIPITLGRDPKTCISKDNLVIHLNGYIKDLSPDKLHNEFKLSRRSYINDSFTESKWATLFRHDIENAKVIFFLGYSLQYDIEIQRVLSSNDNIKRKCFFITKEDSNQISIEIMNEMGKVECIGIEGFSKEIKKTSENYIPMDYIDDTYYSFEKMSNTNLHIEGIRDKDIMDLLIKGNISFSHIYNNNHIGKYIINREQIGRILSDLKQEIKLAIVHSDLGNGKTIFINDLISNLLKEGSHVFIFKNKTDSYISEVEKIASLSGTKYIFVENYNLYLKELSDFKLYDTKDIKFILTSRSFINDSFYLHLTNSMDIDDRKIGIYEINRLSRNEIISIVRLFNEYHLWGEHASLNDNQKIKILEQNFKGNFQSILLGILESKFIVNKISEILATIKRHKDVEDIIFTSFINSTVNLDLKLDDIMYLLEQVNLNASIMRDPAVNELIDIKQNKVLVKSSILAQYVLKSTKNSNKVIELLIKIMQSADQKDLNDKYYSLMKLLVSFSNLRLLINENGADFSNQIIKYYENVKNLDFNKKNPFFWFQYAIARLDLKQYAAAKIYFDNAYSYAKNMDKFDTFQLNTHYARYLLENEIHHGNDASAAFENFTKAHDLIYNNRNKSLHLHYPLRHTGYYFDIFSKFYHLFSNSEKTKFTICCYKILEKIGLYKEAVIKKSRNVHPVVRNSERKINMILTQIRMGDEQKKTPVN